jgi:hypothetical protein
VIVPFDMAWPWGRLVTGLAHLTCAIGSPGHLAASGDSTFAFAAMVQTFKGGIGLAESMAMMTQHE